MQWHTSSCVEGPRSLLGVPVPRVLAANSEESRSLAVRSDLVSRVRRQIAAGTYETPEKLEIALHELMARIWNEDEALEPSDF